MIQNMFGIGRDGYEMERRRRKQLVVRKSFMRKTGARWPWMALGASLCLMLVVMCALSLGGAAPEDPASGDLTAAFRSAVSAAANAQVIRMPEAAFSGSGEGAGATQDGEDAGNFIQPADPLLVLVNDSVPLPESWQVDLRDVADDIQLDARAVDALTQMLQAAGEDGVTLWVASGYRSVDTQQIILERAVANREDSGMTREEAEQDALHTIQRPGYSEHHTGLAVDFNDVSEDFENTDAYAWLCTHAAEYGFVQRYRRDKVEWTGIDTESWHYRYVGRENAREMERLDLCLEEFVGFRR